MRERKNTRWWRLGLTLGAALLVMLAGTAPADAAAVPQHWSFTCLTGGAFGCLDKQPIVNANPDFNLVTGAMADVQVGGLRYTYQFDKDGTAAESSPAVIRPDDYDTNGPGVWNLSGVYAASVKVGGVDVQVQDPELTALAGLTFADASIIQLTGASAAAILTCGGADRIIGSNADNSALECKATWKVNGLNLGGIVMGDSTPGVDGGFGYSSNAFRFFGNGEDALLTFGTNTVTLASNTGITDLLLGPISLGTTGTMTGRVLVIPDADGRSIATTEIAGHLHLATGGGTWTLPDMDAAALTGWSMCIYSTTAAQVVLDPNAEDKLRYAGVLGAAGASITSGSAAGDYTCAVLTDFAGDVAHWTIFGGTTWTPE